MPTTSPSLGLPLLMFATGVGIPIMAALNAGLGTRLGSPWVAAFILLLVGALAAGICLLAIGVPPRMSWKAPPQFFMAGLLVAFYVLSVTWVAPRIGVGNAVFFVLIGQIAAAATIDHFGLFGAIESPITARRWLGIGFMAVGVYLARRI